jgi:hypothetical protein
MGSMPGYPVFVRSLLSRMIAGLVDIDMDSYISPATTEG